MFDGLVRHLASHGERVAVLTDERTLTYRELADETASVAAELGAERRLVLIEPRNELSTLVAYLGALAAHHVVMPLPAGGDHETVIRTYAPDVIVRNGSIAHRPGPGRRMHPALALLLSTSGSTGSPKLVRLSTANLGANAESIAQYLDIRQTDRAATTLPMSYCYGLSVIHSHLLRGAGLILTDRSVVDDQFWESFGRQRGTTFAGVPHTFELLDRIGFDGSTVPDLRYVTQAGGRLPPARVRHFAAMGRRHGWDLFVMYGATEATARMAYLPPELALDHPNCIGVPISGGAFDIESTHSNGADEHVGELVYRGPNVMMGYATGLGDLADGCTVDALRTGDIAVRHPTGLYEVLARSDRFVKLYGLRIDLQRIEETLCERGVTALCTDHDGRLVVAAARRPDGCDVLGAVAAACGLPGAAVRVVDVDAIPLLSTGKPDYQAVRDAVRDAEIAAPEPLDLPALFADVLYLDPASIDPECSFVDLGGNSLSYVTMSVRLERAIGHLPADWPRMPLRELLATRRPRRWWAATLETSVALRAIAIVFVVVSHAELYTLWGGAHVLLGIAGYNFGRFCLTPLPRRDRVRHLGSTIGWIAVPSVLWVAFALLVTDDYTGTNLLLANKFLGPSDSMTAGRLWFVEVVVWILVVLAAVLWLPSSDRMERQWPFGFAVAFLAMGLALRYDVFGFGLGRDAWFTVLAFWFFAVGWVAAKATSAWQRAAVTVVLAIAVFGYFGNPERELLVFAGLTLLSWLPALRCPAALTVAAGMVAEASLFIYLVHYQVYPLFGPHKVIGVAASIVVGVLLTQLLTMGRRRIRDRRLQTVSPVTAPVPR
jgi:acyl-CoA synthetase (AMP-forming)/AMP-acid ligase II